MDRIPERTHRTWVRTAGKCGGRQPGVGWIQVGKAGDKVWREMEGERLRRSLHMKRFSLCSQSTAFSKTLPGRTDVDGVIWGVGSTSFFSREEEELAGVTDAPMCGHCVCRPVTGPMPLPPTFSTSPEASTVL
jgi:hypothetical protein